MPQTIEVESIQRLDVKPGETLVVRLPERTTSEVARQVKAAVEAAVPDGVQVLITSANIELTVVADGCPSSPA